MTPAATTIDRPDVSTTWHPSRATGFQQPLVSVVLLISLILIRAPALLGNDASVEVYAVSLIPFSAAIGALLLQPPMWRVSTRLLLVLAYVTLLIIAAFRGAHYGAISSNGAALEAVQFTLITVLGIFAFLREPRDHQRAQYLRSLCWAPAVFLAFSVVLHIAGFVAPGEIVTGNQPATMLELLGLSVSRVSFPLSGGINGIAPIAVAALVISITFARRGNERMLAIFGALLSLYVIVLIDSRGALMFSVLALAILAFVPGMRKRGLGWIPIALPILPVLLVIALTGLAGTNVGTNLNRQGGEDISTGTGRTVVWGQVTDVLSKPSIPNLVGYGQNGQITSGASVGYAYLFRNQVDPLSRSAHNLVLQTALDIGWLGALCLVALTVVMLLRLSRRSNDPVYAALRSAVLALILLGVVQADPTPIHPDTFGFWLLAGIAAMRTIRPAPATSELPGRPVTAAPQRPGRPSRTGWGHRRQTASAPSSPQGPAKDARIVSASARISLDRLGDPKH